jgi:hypothetical protein
MSVPPTILSLIRTVGGLALPGALAENGDVCEGAKHHSPRPLIVHEFEVRRDGLRVIEAIEDVPDSVWLCATCADNVRVALALFASHGGALPWEARREFGNLVRAIAQKPYEEQPA